jgi:hypothetical protein
LMDVFSHYLNISYYLFPTFGSWFYLFLSCIYSDLFLCANTCNFHFKIYILDPLLATHETWNGYANIHAN